MRVVPTILLLLLSASAAAVIIDSDDGSGNTTTPPSPDPGWAHVGILKNRSGVYLGDGWVITAAHVGAGDIEIDGIDYFWIPGTEVRLDDGGGLLADLTMFMIVPEPPLPPLPIAASTPTVGTLLILGGHGRNRGVTTSWNPPGPLGPFSGYEWALGRALRWGTNFVEEIPVDPVLGTWAFKSIFDEAGSAHEAQGAKGDSGGAAFAWTGSDYELAGVIYANDVYGGQPADTSLYTQTTIAADLSVYRDQILDVIAMPEPSGALLPGCALLWALGRRRRARDAPMR